MSTKIFGAARVRVADLSTVIATLGDTIADGSFGPTLERAVACHYTSWRRKWEDTQMRMGRTAPQGHEHGTAMFVALNDIAGVTRRLEIGGRRDPLYDFEVGFSAWIDPADPEWMLVHPFSEQDGMRADLAAAIGGQDWSYWNNTEGPGGVPEEEWKARAASWEAVGGRLPMVWRWDAPERIWGAVQSGHVDAARVAQILFDRAGRRLGLESVEDAVAAFTGRRDKPLTDARRRVLEARSEQMLLAAAEVDPGDLMTLALVALAVDNDEPWRPLLGSA